MKVGDLVRHRTDGELGVCVGVDAFAYGKEYLVTWFDYEPMKNMTVRYCGSAAECHVEAVS